MSIGFLEDIATFTRGQLGHGHHGFVGSRQIESNAPAGVYVVPTGDGLCDLPTSAAQIEAKNGGVLELLVDRIANANGLEYAADDYARYVNDGHIVMVTEEAVSDQDPVFIRFASGSGTQLGAARTDADDLTVDVTIVTTADGAVFEVELNGVQLRLTSGSSQTAAQKATAFAAYVDGLAAFAAAAVGAVVTITPVSGVVELGEVSPAEILTAAAQGTAFRLPGARFIGDATSGLAMVKITD